MKKLSDRWMYYSGILAMMCPSVNVDDLKHIQDLIDAEEQGLLLRLPCKVGDYVWSAENGRVKQFVVSHFEVCMKSIYAFQEDVFIGEMGFTVFTTREKAEKALEKMRGEEHETN